MDNKRQLVAGIVAALVLVPLTACNGGDEQAAGGQDVTEELDADTLCSLVGQDTIAAAIDEELRPGDRDEHTSGPITDVECSYTHRSNPSVSVDTRVSMGRGTTDRGTVETQLGFSVEADAIEWIDDLGEVAGFARTFDGDRTNAYELVAVVGLGDHDVAVVVDATGVSADLTLDDFRPIADELVDNLEAQYG